MFDSIQGNIAYRKIWKGEKGNLSISQIVMGAISLVDAKKNLTPAEFERVITLFFQYKKDKVKREYDAESISKEILKMFLYFDFEADIRKYAGDHPIARMWRTNDNLDQLREKAHFAKQMVISGEGVIREAKKFLERYKNISVDDIVAAAQAGKITKQQAESTIQLKNSAEPVIVAETEKVSHYKREYEESRIAFMKENSLLNGMPEMLKTIYQERGLAHYDKVFVETFPNMKNPYTNEPIKSVQDYIDAIDSENAKRAIKTERKLTIEEIDKIFEQKYGDQGFHYIGRRILCVEDFLEAIAAMRLAKKLQKEAECDNSNLK